LLARCKFCCIQVASSRDSVWEEKVTPQKSAFFVVFCSLFALFHKNWISFMLNFMSFDRKFAEKKLELQTSSERRALLGTKLRPIFGPQIILQPKIRAHFNGWNFFSRLYSLETSRPFFQHLFGRILAKNILTFVGRMFIQRQLR